MELGRQFGTYRILKLLGHGGMAEVYLAVRACGLGANRFCALKCILPAYNNVEEYIRLFYHEGSVGLRLSHGNLVGTSSCEVIEGRHTMVMDYLPGKSVESLLEQGALPLDIALWIAISALDGLGYLHRLCDECGRPLHIVHRDVTPGNIQVLYDGSCRVFDFGVAHCGTDVDDIQSGMIVGKYAYTSPEQCRGETLDARSDLFSLSAVLYEMCTGVSPFLRENDIKTLDAVSHGIYEKPERYMPEMPIRLRQILERGLSNDQDMRYMTAESYADDLREVLNSLGIRDGQTRCREYMSRCYSESIAQEQRFFREVMWMIPTIEPSLETLVRASEAYKGDNVGTFSGQAVILSKSLTSERADSGNVQEVVVSKLSSYDSPTLPKPMGAGNVAYAKPMAARDERQVNREAEHGSWEDRGVKEGKILVERFQATGERDVPSVGESKRPPEISIKAQTPCEEAHGLGEEQGFADADGDTKTCRGMCLSEMMLFGDADGAEEAHALEEDQTAVPFINDAQKDKPGAVARSEHHQEGSVLDGERVMRTSRGLYKNILPSEAASTGEEAVAYQKVHVRESQENRVASVFAAAEQGYTDNRCYRECAPVVPIPSKRPVGNAPVLGNRMPREGAPSRIPSFDNRTTQESGTSRIPAFKPQSSMRMRPPTLSVKHGEQTPQEAGMGKASGSVIPKKNILNMQENETDRDVLEDLTSTEFEAAFDHLQKSVLDHGGEKNKAKKK